MSDVPRYRRLYAHEWHDPDFRRLNDSARVVRIYISAGPQTTSNGCFRLSTALAVEDLGGTAEQFEERLETVCEAFGWAWDPLARVIWIRDWFDTNPPASPNVVASWAKLLRNVPACAVRDEAIASITASLKNLPATFREPWTELSKSFRRSEVRSEVQPETNQGSGIREFRSGKQRAGALRADAAKKNQDAKTFPEPDARMLRIARDVISESPRDTTTDYLCDDFLARCRHSHIEANRSLALVYLAKSQEGQTA